jgi:hypothetical protein
MNVVGHDAQRIKLEAILIQSLLNRVKKYMTTFGAGKSELAIVTTGSDVVAVSFFIFASGTGHKATLALKDGARY